MRRALPQGSLSLKYRQRHQFPCLLVDELIEHPRSVLARPDHAPPPKLREML